MFAFDAIGTSWTIDTEDLSQSVQQEILDRIDVFDAMYSRFRPDSLVTRMSQTKGVYVLPKDAQPLFDLYQTLYVLTNGAMTPLIGKTLEQAGYDANYSLQSGELVSPPLWNDALIISYPNIEILQPVLLDVGAAGKGYLIDIVGEILKSHNVQEFIIDAGGDIVHVSETHRITEIALENPADASQAIGVVRISNQSICGSAGNRRAWADFTHIINPNTLSSATDIAATWVVASTGLLADGLATALYFAHPELLLSEFSFEYLILYIDGSVVQSSDFPAELFYQ